MKEKVVLIYGGKSVEHDISIITALQAKKHLPKNYDYLMIYMDKTGLFWTADNLEDIDVYSDFEKKAKNKREITFFLGKNVILVKKKNKFVFKDKVLAILNCCHGGAGEDGALQGLFEVCQVPQTSSGVTSSALCMDKAFMKDILKANSIKTAPYVYFDRCAYDKLKAKVLKGLNFPIIVKPANLGSSIGISVCKSKEEFADAVELAFEFDDKILAEKLVENLKEFNCACFNFQGQTFVSHVNFVKNDGKIYTFQDKYLSNQPNSAEAEKKLAKKIQTLTEKLYKLFDCQGIVRVDFLFDEKKQELFVNEINSIPGSLAFYLFKDVPFKDLLGAMIEQSIFVSHEKEKLYKTFDSDALKIFANSAQHHKK